MSGPEPLAGLQPGYDNNVVPACQPTSGRTRGRQITSMLAPVQRANE
ncbi:MAG: hypothetical protein ACRDRJ_18995 [Streptosporangiaceae bacterium]